MIFAFLTFSRALERNMTFEGVQIKYGIDTDGFAYFGSASKAQNAINFTYSGAVLLPEGLKYRNRTIKFKMIKEFAFANTKITSISLPATLKWIGRSSFENCVGLTVINASDTNLTMIDRRAFKGCRNLRNIFLPSSVFAFGRSTFEGTLITHIPNLNYTLIEDFSFANNHEIMAVDLSKSSLTVIGESLFENCTKLMTIVLPDSIYYIKSKAFARTSIKSFDLPKNISVIHKYVFCGCKSITSADLSNHPTNCISEGLYCNCTCLEHIVLPKKCYWIGPYSFYNTKIKSISLPKECHSVGEYSFGECRELASADFGQTMIENLTNGLFFNCSKLITFKYPKVIRSIGSYALYNTKFTDIGPLKYLESLDSNSFTNSKIQNVNMINATILTLPSKLFYNNKNIISINISNKTKYIGSYAFSGTLLTTIYIPPNITEFGEGALSFCPKLTHMLLNVTRLLELPKNMFENCFNLSFVRVPRYLNTLGDGCFKNCINLECVYGSRRLKIIGQRSFYNCTSIREVDFSKTEISYIDESAFAFCSNLTRFVMSIYTLGTGPLAFANTGLKSFEFFHNIGTKCLFNCTDLEFVNMSSSTITILNSELFGNCKNLKSVHLPKLVIFIGKSVFRNCPNLHTVYYNGTQPLDLSKLPKNCKVLPPPILNMTNTTSNSLVNVSKI